MFSSRRRKTFGRLHLWIGSATALLLGALAFIFVANRNPSTVPELAPVVESELVLDRKMNDSPNEFENSIVVDVLEEQVVDVWELCEIESWPNSQESAYQFVKNLKLSEECEAALEAHALSSNPFHRYPHVKFVRFDPPMTYERIFSDPTSDLEGVIAALSRAECRLEEGTVANWELKETCHAEAFASYAAFYDVCYRRSAWLYIEAPLRNLADNRTMPSDRMKSIWQGYLEQRWADQQCAKFDSTVRLTAERYPKQHELLYSFGVNDDPKYRLNSYEYISPWEIEVLERALISLAARLGAESATMEYLPDSELELYYHEQQPWRKVYREMVSAQDRGNKFRSALALVLTFKADGMDFDWEALVDYICSNRKYEEQGRVSPHHSCETLISYVHERVDPTHDRAEELLQVLDQFKRIALDLNVYH